MNISSDTSRWLLDSTEPYIRYQAQRLLDPDSADATLLDDDPFIQENLHSVASWRSEVLERHDKPGLFIHRLAMLADLGVSEKTVGAGALIADLISNIAADGSFPIKISIPKVFGGTGEASDEWIICDFPVVVYALLKMGVADERLRRSVSRLVDLAGDEYYPCCGSIPKFKGPGPRGGMCPYANLLVARALSASEMDRSQQAAQTAAQAVLSHWTDRTTKKPFLFGMGTDFRKLKFPMVWYNILHVVSALGEIGGVARDSRFREMLGILNDKLDADGRVRPESMYMIYKTHEWSDKKKPSRLLTIIVNRILSKYEIR